MELSLNWRTRNGLGTTFGGSTYDDDLVDADGTVHAEIEKAVYVRRDG